MAGRRPLTPLSGPPTLGPDGRPVGEVARLFDDWLEARQATNKIASRRTVDGYRDDLARWAALLIAGDPASALDRLALADLTDDRIRVALAVMNRAGYSVAARQRALAPLRGMCGWLVRRGTLARDPFAADELTVKGAGLRLPASFDDDELARILGAIDEPISDQRARLRWAARDRAALALLAGCALRVSEACGLTWDRVAELDEAGGDPSVRVVGKGRVERVVPLSGVAADTLRRYRDERISRAAALPALGVRPKRAVLVQTDGRRVSPTTLNAWQSRWLRLAGVSPRPGAAAHAFRHTAADGWLANGASLAEVQALLGHASIATTGIYVRARDERLRSVVTAGRFEQTARRAASR